MGAAAAYDHQRAVESDTQVVVDRIEGRRRTAASIVLLRYIDDLITPLVEQIAATDVF